MYATRDTRKKRNTCLCLKMGGGVKGGGVCEMGGGGWACRHFEMLRKRKDARGSRLLLCALNPRPHPDPPM